MKAKDCLVIFFGLLLVYSCSKKDPAPAGNPDTPTVSAVINDTGFASTEGQGNITTSAFYIHRFISEKDYSSAFESQFLNDTTKVFTVTIGSLHYTSNNGVDTVSNNDFYNYLTVGNYSYADPFNSLKSVEITFTDPKSRKVFSSGLGGQQSASFNITSVQKLMYRGTAAVKVTAVFTCTLFDSNGRRKNITNGALRMYFQNH